MPVLPTLFIYKLNEILMKIVMEFGESLEIIFL